jgi:hypothetical protein
MKAEGIDYVPVDRELSVDKWIAGVKNGKKVLVGPLQNVKGIGAKMVNQIMGARLRNEPLPARFDKLINGAATEIDSLNPIRDAVEKLMPDPSERNIHTPPTDIADLQINGEEYPALVFALVSQIKQKDDNDETSVARRKGRVYTGPTQSLNLTIMDDTDRMFAKINRYDYEKLGKEVIERGKPGKALYAIKGSVPKDFRMLWVKNIRFIGYMDEAK